MKHILTIMGLSPLIMNGYFNNPLNNNTLNHELLMIFDARLKGVWTPWMSQATSDWTVKQVLRWKR